MMRQYLRLAAASAVLLAAGAASAEPVSALETAFEAAAWTRLAPATVSLPPVHARLVQVDSGEDLAPTLQHLLNGPGRPALEAILRDGGAVFVRRRASAPAFTADPLLTLQLGCPVGAPCPGAVTYTAPGSGLIITGSAIEEGYLLVAPAASRLESVPSVDRATDVPHFAIRLPAAVPEPRSWALLILGFGLVGAAARRGPILSGEPLAR